MGLNLSTNPPAQYSLKRVSAKIRWDASEVLGIYHGLFYWCILTLHHAISYTLPEINELHLKIDGWKLEDYHLNGWKHITPQKAIYISGIEVVYTANWGIICTLPPFRGTRNNHWSSFWDGLVSVASCYCSFRECNLYILGTPWRPLPVANLDLLLFLPDLRACIEWVEVSQAMLK